MRIFKSVPTFDFLGKRKITAVLSVCLIAASIFFIATRGFNFGIDFTGGYLVEVAYPETAELQELRTTMRDAGFGDVSAQYFGTTNEAQLRIELQEGEKSNKEIREDIEAALRGHNSNVDIRSFSFVGPSVGEELKEKGGQAAIIALVLIFFYVWMRFEWRFSIGAIIALVHDVIITLGVFSLLQLPFDMNVLAAILAVIGYSLNDTVVVFDRIRENFLRMRNPEPLGVMNTSINEMLARTLVTSVTTMIVVLCLYFIGGENIKPFAFTLIIGIMVGTYSSIYVASATALASGVSKEDLLPKEIEDDILDEMP